MGMALLVWESCGFHVVNDGDVLIEPGPKNY